MANATVSVSAKYVLSLYYEYRVMFSKVLSSEVRSGKRWPTYSSVRIWVLSSCTLPLNMHHRIGQSSTYVTTRHLRICRGTDARQQYYYYFLYYDRRTNSGGNIFYIVSILDLRCYVRNYGQSGKHHLRTLTCP